MPVIHGEPVAVYALLHRHPIIRLNSLPRRIPYRATWAEVLTPRWPR